MQEFVIDNESLNESTFFDKHPIIGDADHSYLSASMKELLAKLRDFSHGEESIALLLGGKSIGKTTFLKYFQTHYSSVHCWVQGQAKMDLVRLLSSNFLEPDSETTLSSATSLDFVLQEISKKFQHFTLIIDDADQLALDNFQQILLAFSKQTVVTCKVILAGETSMEKRIGSLSDDSTPISFKSFCLEPLSFNETCDYLKDYFPRITNRNKLNFSKKAIKKIFHYSMGYLGRINRVAPQFASEDQVASYPLIKKKKSFIDLLLALGIFCLVGIVGFRVSVMILAKSHVPHAMVIPTKTLTKPIAVKHDPPVEVKPLFKDDEMPNYIASIINEPVISLISEIILPEPQRSPVVIHHKNPAETTKQKVRGYTLQLVAAHKKETIISWLETIRSSTFTHLCTIKKVNESWHVLNYGFYHTRQQAESALNKLPNKVKHQKPLIRVLI